MHSHAIIYRTLFAVLSVSIAQQSVAQQPASKPKPVWAVEYADKFCALVHMPQDGKPGIIIRQRPLSSYFQLLILTPLAGRKKTELGTLTFAFGDGEKFTAYGMRALDLPERGLRVIETGLPKVQMELAEANGGFRATVPGVVDVVVPLPLIGKARRVLDTCSADLLKSWKIERTWVVDAKEGSDVRFLFSGDDYPEALRDGNKQGMIVALMKIGVDGRVRSCKAQESEGDPRFEAVTCNILTKRARYEPATDASGKPVDSFALSPPIRWLLSY